MLSLNTNTKLMSKPWIQIRIWNVRTYKHSYYACILVEITLVLLNKQIF